MLIQQTHLEDAVAVPRRVLIILMPWATTDFPGIGPSLIRSILLKDGIPCDIHYGNLVFARLSQGSQFDEHQFGKIPMCEGAFSPYYFNISKEQAATRIQKYISDLAPDSSSHTHHRYMELVERAGNSLDETFDSTDWDQYDIVGFSVMLQQCVASLALARRIKANFPRISTIFGGPSASWDSAKELMRSFPEIDYVVSGEADAVITPLVRQIRSGSKAPVFTPGIHYRSDNGTILNTGKDVPFNGMDSLPIPDYEPFFEQLAANGLFHVEPYVPLEMSRGCWWGEKHHCSFCGIEDSILRFRSKSETRVLEEILTLSTRHKTTEFFTVDSIINYRFFKTLLPTIATLREERKFDFTFFFESKSNLRREHALAFRNAGVNSVQPGLESFSDHVLELMDKGTTGARQIQCLRLLAEHDIVANWNILFSNPGETPSDYEEITCIIPFLHHLPPLHDDGLVPVQINRFAPYYERPQNYGITGLKSKEYYSDVFADPAIDIDQIAFYFDYQHPVLTDTALIEMHEHLHRAIDHWRQVYRKASLIQRKGPNFIVIEDTRVMPGADGSLNWGRHEEIVLSDCDAEIFSYCDEVKSISEVERTFSSKFTQDYVRSLIDELVSRKILYCSPAGQLITLPLHEPIPNPWAG